MDINFRKEKRNSLLGKRFRDQDKDDDRKVESDMEMDNFQTENMDFSLGKPYLDKYFNSNLAYPAVPEKKLRGTITTEVFRVIINMEGGREGYLSGKIYFSNLSHHIYIYKQGGEPGQYVKPIKEGCDLLTTVSGQYHVIPSSDTVCAFVDLLLSSFEHQPLTNCDIPQHKPFKDRPIFHYDDSMGSLYDYFETEIYDMEKNDTDDELDDVVEGNFVRITNCKGSFCKNGLFKENMFGEGLVYRPSEEIFDKSLSYMVLGKDNKCSVTILYALFRKAVQAVVEVWLKDEEPESSVYGLIAARNDMIKEDAYEIILFLKEDLRRSVPVVSGKPIQLSRSVVAVPINSNLLVRAHLRTNYKVFPSAKLLFPAQQAGVSELSIKDTVQVKVTWQHIW